MKHKTWEFVKQEAPVVFTASMVSLLSYSIWQANTSTSVFTLSFWRSFGNVLLAVSIAILAVYAVLWILHKASHTTRHVRNIHRNIKKRKK